MVFVTVSETYDLSTKAGKMTLIGIHTPDKKIIQKTYPGLCMNSKFCRIVKQDVTLACASMLPASVGDVGLGVDDIAPQDLFNPILYKAVSNESMSTLEARLAGLGYITPGTFATVEGNQAVASEDAVTGLSDEFNVYYSLLSNRDGFRTANPQQGLQMKNLVPLVFEKWYNTGVNGVIAPNSAYDDSIPVIAQDPQTKLPLLTTYKTRGMRGKAHPMPKFNTTYITSEFGNQSSITQGKAQWNGMGNGVPTNCQIEMPDIPPVYTACIVMPPSKRHLLYYRMVVRTTLEFTEVRPIQEITSFSQMDAFASEVYHSDYNEQSASMTAKLGMVDAENAELTKIMEGA